MKPVVSWSVVAVLAPFGLLLATLVLSGCSIPNLEPAECDQARDVTREFYSKHFGSELDFSAETIEARKEYLTTAFSKRLSALPATVDPFTLTDDRPKAFRAGECKVLEPGRRVSFTLLLFWKTDTRSEERTITVEAENQEGKWLIDRVSN